MSTQIAAFDFEDLFEAAPCALLVVAADLPRFTITAVTDSYLAATLTRRDIIGAPLFEVFPDNPKDPGATGVRNLTASLLRVVQGRVADTMPLQRYDIPSVGVVREFEERHWIPHNAPFGSQDGSPSHVIHRVEDVTSLVRAGARATEGLPPKANQYVVRLASNMDLPHLRDVVRSACAACELDELSVMDLLIAASELGRNIVNNGSAGTVEVSELGLELPRGVQLHFREEPDGRGLAEARVSLASGVGLSLHSPRQLVDDFAASADAAGTALTITKWKKRRSGRLESTAGTLLQPETRSEPER